jgi:phthalate 4,5-cis-dihydrodiol dehydrogenase
MRHVVDSGRIGRLRAITHWSFGDWMLRPRMPHELSTDGGMLLNQGPHAVDAIRVIGNGMVRSVRGATIDVSLQGRPCAGYLTAFMEFDDGTAATMIHNGYGYLYGWEFTPWANEQERLKAMTSSYEFRRGLRTGTTDETRLKEQSRFGGKGEDEKDFREERKQGVKSNEGWVPHDEGLAIAHGERGAVRQSASGLYVYDDEGRWEETMPPEAGDSAEANEIDELLNGIAGKAVLRDGRWGKATLEVVLAIAESSESRRDVILKHQVPLYRTQAQ